MMSTEKRFSIRRCWLRVASTTSQVVRVTRILSFVVVMGSAAFAQSDAQPASNRPLRLTVLPTPTAGAVSSRFSGSVEPRPDLGPKSGLLQGQRASLPHLYMHFLLYQNHLDRAAAAHEQQGKDGNWLRNHFQQRLGLSNGQFAAVREAAQRLEPKLKDIQARAKVIIEADRAGAGIPSRPRLAVQSANATPRNDVDAPVADVTPAPRVIVPASNMRKTSVRGPGWAQLRQLQEEREAVIQNEISSLKDALGPESAAKLDDFLQNTWARQVTSIHFKPKAGLAPQTRKPAEVHP